MTGQANNVGNVWMKSWKMFAATALMLVAWLLPGLARAQTVDEIVSRGTINIGVLVDLPPYGLLNDKQEPDGYDIEVAKLLGKYMGVKVNLVTLTSPNRIPFLVTNKVDLIVATFGITPERAKQVLFSIPYSAIENVVFAPKDKHIASLDDLKGLRGRRAAGHRAGRDPDPAFRLSDQGFPASTMTPRPISR